MSSSIRIIEDVRTVVGGQELPALHFVRQYKNVAAAVSKATPDRERVARDSNGNRKMTAPDHLSLLNVHRSIIRRMADAKMTLQMLPDLKLGLELIVSLIMSPKDMRRTEVVILSETEDLLPASVRSSMLAVTNAYYRKNYDLTTFMQDMLAQVLGYQGALPVIVLPENALDSLINNYNANITLESFRTEFDVDRNVPHPLGMLGVPDYLTGQKNKTQPTKSSLRFGSEVNFDLEAFDSYRDSRNNSPSSSNSYIHLSRLYSGESHATWNFGVGTTNTNEEQTVNADELLVVTDNIMAMKLPDYKAAAVHTRIGDVLMKRGYNKFQASLESIGQTFSREQKEKIQASMNGRTPSDEEVESMIFKNRRFAYTPIATIPNNSSLKRNSVGEPLVKIISTAAFMPASIEGNPKVKLGGFILLDENGFPLTPESYEQSELVDLSSYASGSGNFISSMNQRANSMLNGKDCNGMNNAMLRQFFNKTFSEQVEKDIIDRIKNGQYNNGAQLGSNDDFYWLMFTRCMRGQRTQLLWVPAEFLTYFALDYDELGFGKSMLDDIRNITSMRIMLMVSGIATSLKNSIGRTKVSIKLDENDQDAERSIEDIQDEILKSRMNPIPFGINNVADITKYLQRSCYEFEITGSNQIPDMQVSFDQYNSNYPQPDENLQEQLKDLSLHHLGLTRDQIDASEGMDFAIQQATSNRLTMKRIQVHQHDIIPQVGDHVRKITYNSEHLISSYREILENNFEQFQTEKIKRFFNLEDESLLKNENFKKFVVEQSINEFIRNMRVELPSPDSTSLDVQKQMFDDAADFYRTAIDYIINESFFDEVVQGEGKSDKVDMIKNIIVSHYMREFMAKNNILPELAELTTIGEDGKVAMNIMDSLEKHIMALGMSTENFFSRFRRFAELQTSLMQKVGESSTDGPTDTGGGGSSDDDTSSDNDDDDGLDDPLFSGPPDDPDSDPDANPDDDTPPEDE